MHITEYYQVTTLLIQDPPAACNGAIIIINVLKVPKTDLLRNLSCQTSSSDGEESRDGHSVSDSG